ncbi:hypothetical protein SF274771_3024 [Shigella flexneri 2747-71]|nr:hypothetical protein SF274771_3024 [Shigella flexneri 2747-71]
MFDFHDLHTLSPLRGSHKKSTDYTSFLQGGNIIFVDFSQNDNSLR